MKRVYVCGSFRFLDKIEELEKRLRKENIECVVSKTRDARGFLGCLEKIDDADVVYVVNPEGYVGKSVCLDIGYAYAKNKQIFVMNSVDDPPLMELTDGTLSFEETVSLLRKEAESKQKE
jgi:hypothetical protein